MSSLSLFFVPRNKKVHFEIDILIQELINVPLVSGSYYIKWKLKNGERTNSMTERAPIKHRSIAWNYKLQNSVQIIIGKDGVLMPCELSIKVKQELNGGKEVNNIGKLLLNLSEYVGLNSVTQRYLLQDSKINSTLKLTINMKQTSGKVGFKVPSIKKPQIFGGIAGIITERTERQDDTRSLRGLRPNFGQHCMARSRSNTSLRSAYYSQANQTTPTTSSLVANSFLRKVGGESSTDVVEDIFMGTAIVRVDAVDDNKSEHSAFF
ncbi:945_t:CDS:2 [Funneliformis caledonium]|uniref:945_t:CDS:1 n=1 Tax=Funneliformis caledonium TaxID=1117310 RepID=A0A9N9AZ41_9GLOM|nr:945_t:CDS:2 [Funneliformis caledonium]